MSKLNFFGLLVISVSINLGSVISVASPVPPTKCTFASNEAMRGLLSELPKSVIGVATCDEEFKDLSSFVVFKFKALEEKLLDNAVIQIANTNHPANESAEVTWQSKQPLAIRQLIVTTKVAKTDHSNAQVMLHYAFVAKANDGSFLVFVHSAPEKETHALRQALEEMNRQLRTPYFLKLITG